MRRYVFLLGLTTVLGVGSASGQETASGVFGDFSLRSSQEPVEIRSKQLDVDAQGQTAIFRGEVQVVQGSITMHSDVLTVAYMEADGRQEVREIQAEGNVRILQGPRKATGEQAVFDQEKRVLRLTGDATLVEGANQISGDTILVYPDESRMEVTGENRRVKVILFPGEEAPGEVREPEPDEDPASSPSDDTPAESEANGTDGSDGR